MRSCTCASRTRSSTAVEPHLCRVCRDQHGGVVRVEDRGHFYDPVGALRDVVVNHLMQVVAAAAIEPPAGRDRDAIRKARVALLPAVDDADPANYVRGQYDGYWSIPGVATDSTTETFAAVRLDIENWRWSGVLFFIRTGKRLPVTKTELRIVFMEPPEIAFGFGLDRNNRPARDQFVVKFDPGTGVRLLMEARRTDAQGPQPISLDMEFADEGGEAPTPYEVLLHAAIVGQTGRFNNQDVVRKVGGSCSRFSMLRRPSSLTRQEAGGQPPPMS
jgi:glucose-6-phosphate 1-dehydrogenase